MQQSFAATAATALVVLAVPTAVTTNENVREQRPHLLWAILSAPVFPRPACAAVVALEVGGLGLRQPGAEEVGEIPIRVIKPCLLCTLTFSEDLLHRPWRPLSTGNRNLDRSSAQALSPQLLPRRTTRRDFQLLACLCIVDRREACVSEGLGGKDRGTS